MKKDIKESFEKIDENIQKNYIINKFKIPRNR